MKVTADLIKKYHLGLCSSEEASAVEQWLNSESEEDSTLAEKELDEMASNVWNVLSPRLHSQSTLVVPMYKKVTSYVAFACLAIGFCAGYFLAPSPSTPASEGVAKTLVTSEGPLYISSYRGKSQKITADHCEVKFEGQLQLMNTSSYQKFVTCKGKTFTLQPKRDYLLINPTVKEPYLRTNIPKEYDIFWSQETSFQVCIL